MGEARSNRDHIETPGTQKPSGRICPEKMNWIFLRPKKRPMLSPRLNEENLGKIIKGAGTSLIDTASFELLNRNPKYPFRVLFLKSDPLTLGIC
jgi:hypothetical protein